MSLWQRVVEANRPGPPEHSLVFRGASVAAVVVAAGACSSEGEISVPVAAFTVVATVVGNVLSYRRRTTRGRRPSPSSPSAPWPASSGSSPPSPNATPGDISTVEGPLAVLFAWVLSTHAFDVPARRDVAYSLAGSAALMAVAAAQAVDLGFGLWVLAWMACAVTGLVAMWQSMSGTRGPLADPGGAAWSWPCRRPARLGATPPQPSTSLIFPSAGTGQPGLERQPADRRQRRPCRRTRPAPRAGPGSVAFSGSPSPSTPPTGPGWATRSCCGCGPRRPGYWVGQTFDHWDGQNWTQSADPANGTGVDKLTFGPPFTIPAAPDQAAPLADATADVQTFYLAQSGPNLVFHTDQAERVYIQSRSSS